MVQELSQPSQRAAAERGRVLPAFAEGGFDIADGRAVDRELDVVPGRARPVGRGERLAERVAPVCGVVATAVTQVDAADESDVPLGPSRVTQYDGLLMVRTAGAHPHVEQAFSARRSDLLTEVTVLAFAELEAVQVRTPDQPLDDDSALGRRTQHLSDLATGAVEPFVWIAAPVGEQQQVARLLGADGLEQFTEVHRAVNEGSYLVPRRPRHSPGPAALQTGRRVASLAGREQPVGQFHDPSQGQPPAKEVCPSVICVWAATGSA